MNAKKVTGHSILGIIALALLALVVDGIRRGVTPSQAIAAFGPLVIIASVAGLFFYWDRLRSRSRKPGKLWAAMAMLVAGALGILGIVGLALSIREGQDVRAIASTITVTSLAAGMFVLIFLARRTH